MTRPDTSIGTPRILTSEEVAAFRQKGNMGWKQIERFAESHEVMRGLLKDAIRRLKMIAIHTEYSEAYGKLVPSYPARRAQETLEKLGEAGL